MAGAGSNVNVSKATSAGEAGKDESVSEATVDTDRLWVSERRWNWCDGSGALPSFPNPCRDSQRRPVRVIYVGHHSISANIVNGK